MSKKPTILNIEYVRTMVDGLLAEHRPLQGEAERLLVAALNGLFDGDNAPEASFRSFSTAGGVYRATVWPPVDTRADDIEEWAAVLQDYLEDRFLIDAVLRPRSKAVNPADLVESYVAAPSPLDSLAMDLEGNVLPAP